MLYQNRWKDLAGLIGYSCASNRPGGGYVVENSDWKNNINAFRNVRDLVGGGEVAGRNLWNLLKSLLNSHEQQRFMLLSKISTDLGRGRAWIRSEPFFILIDRVPTIPWFWTAYLLLTLNFVLYSDWLVLENNMYVSCERLLV